MLILGTGFVTTRNSVSVAFQFRFSETKGSEDENELGNVT